MKLYQLITRSLLAFSLITPVAALADANTDGLMTIEPPIASNVANKLEVLEFFSYTCPHCASMAPLMNNWKKNLPESVVVNYVPLAFNASTKPLQRLYYSLVALERTDLHEKVFDAIFKEKKRLFSRDSIIEWGVAQGLNKDELTAAYDSFGVNVKTKQADELADKYRIDATPSIAVAGKYVITSAANETQEQTLERAKKYIEQTLKK